jgi:hypothetical protein
MEPFDNDVMESFDNERPLALKAAITVPAPSSYKWLITSILIWYSSFKWETVVATNK